MARPSRFVNENGKVIGHDTGVSFHVKIARFYTYEAGTSRKLCFKTWAEARDAYLAKSQMMFRRWIGRRWLLPPTSAEPKPLNRSPQTRRWSPTVATTSGKRPHFEILGGAVTVWVRLPEAGRGL